MIIKNQKQLDRLIEQEIQKTAIQLFNQNNFCIAQTVVDAMYKCNPKENTHSPFCSCYLKKTH